MMGFLIQGLPAGDGMLNVPWLLEKVGDRCQSAILELWTPPEKKMEDTIVKEDDWARKSISYLKNIIINMKVTLVGAGGKMGLKTDEQPQGIILRDGLYGN